MLTRQHALTETEKRALRRKLQVKQAHSLATINNGTVSDHKPVNKVREYLAPVKPSYVPMVRGRTGCKLNPEIRAIVEAKRARNQAFHAELRALVRGAL
jgi:hypothetical protein